MIFSTQLWAGGSGNHSHGDGNSHSHGPIEKQAVILKSQAKLTALAKAGKIDASWSTIKAATAEQKDFGKGKEWVISFQNAQVQDSNKQTLYLFYTLNGRYLAANYSGK